jgi:hypothetical protein
MNTNILIEEPTEYTEDTEHKEDKEYIIHRKKCFDYDYEFGGKIEKNNPHDFDTFSCRWHLYVFGRGNQPDH